MVVMGLGLPEVVMVLAVIVIKVIPYIFFAVLVALVVRYLNARPRRDRERKTAHSLGEVLAEERRRCGMTQEFVARELGVSRQAVSKWGEGNERSVHPQPHRPCRAVRCRRGHPYQVGRAEWRSSGWRFLGELGTAG